MAKKFVPKRPCEGLASARNVVLQLTEINDPGRKRSVRSETVVVKDLLSFFVCSSNPVDCSNRRFAVELSSAETVLKALAAIRL